MNGIAITLSRFEPGHHFKYSGALIYPDSEPFESPISVIILVLIWFFRRSAMNRMFRPVLIAFLILLGGVSMPLLAAKAAAKAQTIADPDIPVDELEIKLRPLMRDELKVEADGWLKLLESKVSAISSADIAVKYKRKEIESAEKVEEALEQLEEAKKRAEKTPADGEDGLSVEEAERALEQAKKKAVVTAKKVKSDTEIQKIIALATKKAKVRQKDEATPK